MRCEICYVVISCAVWYYVVIFVVVFCMLGCVIILPFVD